MRTDPLVLAAAGVLGSLFGSFLNVCVYRLPRDQSVVRPRSRCPLCQATIACHDNVPIVSWLLLGGRCRHCRNPIPWRYPVVELAVAGIWLGAAATLGVSWEAISAAILVTLCLGIAMTDAGHLLIPDEFSLGGLAAGLALSIAPGGPSPENAVVGAALGFGLLWVAGTIGAWLMKQDAMGGGDLKMMAMVGSFLGWQGVLAAVFLGALAGSVIYGPLAFRRPRPLVPFGVFLAVGAVATLVAGDWLIARYVAFLRGG